MQRWGKLSLTWRCWIVVVTITGAASIALAIMTGKPGAALSLFGIIIGMALAVSGFVLVGFWLVIALHEAGHVVAGLAAGFKFRSVEVRGLGLRREADRLKLYRVRCQLAGGFALMSPPTADQLARPFRIFILGGPIATVIAFLFSVWLMLATWVPDSPSLAPRLIHFAAVMFFVINFVMLPGALVPRMFKGLATDALLLWWLRKDGPDQMRQLALFHLATEVKNGIRAKDWPPALIDACGVSSDGTLLELRSRYLRYYHFADKGHYDTAWSELSRAVAIGVALGDNAGFLQGVTTWEQVFAASWLMKDLPLAQSCIPRKDDPHELVDGTRERAKAAMALLEGNPEEVRKHIAAARTCDEKVAARFGTRPGTDHAFLNAMEAAT